CRTGSPHSTTWRPNSPPVGGSRTWAAVMALRPSCWPRPTPGQPLSVRTTTANRSTCHGAGVADQISFEVSTAQTFTGSGYDLVATFDCLHDMGDPLGAARHIRDALAADGTWLIVEPYAGDAVSDNLNPIGRMCYSFSRFLCVPN